MQRRLFCSALALRLYNEGLHILANNALYLRLWYGSLSETGTLCRKCWAISDNRLEELHGCKETRCKETRCQKAGSQETRGKETRRKETRRKETRSEETRSEKARSEKARAEKSIKKTATPIHLQTITRVDVVNKIGKVAY